MGLLHRHLQTAIKAGVGGAYGFVSVFSALSHFDPPQVAIIRELWLLWMTDILGSRYAVWQRYMVAGSVVELAWGQIRRVVLSPAYNVETTWLPPLLGYLRLGEEFGWGGSPTPPAVFALRILSHCKGSDDFGPTILPILASTLRPTHPIRSRKTALKAFCQFGFGWLSTQMESVSSADRVSLLHAVGDPFQSTPDAVLQDKRHAFEDEYNPMSVAAVLIEFASSDLWRDHLRHSNFISCEEIISTAEGRKSAFKYLQFTTQPWPFLRTPTKIISAIERLEALRCPNTVEVVLTCVWALRGVDGPSVDLDGWRLIRQKTLAFYQKHGLGRLKVLSQHIMATTVFRLHGWDPICRAEGVRLPVRIAKGARRLGVMEDRFSDLPLAQVCQLTMLYQLFGRNPATWEMFVAETEGVDEGVGVAAGSGQPGVPPRFVDWVCDYP